MRRIIGMLLLGTALMLTGCDKNDINPEGVTYDVEVIGLWTMETFPTDFPINAHFSKPVAMSHDANTRMFQLGVLSTPGMINMAETGGISPLDEEIRDMIDAGNALDLTIGDGLSGGTSISSFEIVVDENHQHVSLVTMIAPSPDWFVGVNAVSLYQNGAFVDSLVVNGLVYDAGSDSGSTFTSADQATSPKDGVSMFVDAPLGDGTVIPEPIMQIIFTKR